MDYKFRQSLMHKPETIALLENRLTRQEETKPFTEHKYSDIKQVHLKIICLNKTSVFHLCELSFVAGKKIRVCNKSVIKIGEWQDQSADYVRFVQELHGKLAQYNPSVKLLYGDSPVFRFMQESMIGLAILATVTVFGVLPIFAPPKIAFNISMVLKIGLMWLFVGGIALQLKKNRPGKYMIEKIPEEFLPK
jgi:hypothetical protein